MTTYAYSNNGNSWRMVEPDWELDDGEVTFDHEPSENELLAAFPDRATVRPYLAPLSPRQVRQVLTANNLRTEVESAIAASSPTIKDWWNYASQFERDNAVLVSMAASLGLTDAQVDAMFVQGAAL